MRWEVRGERWGEKDKGKEVRERWVQCVKVFQCSPCRPLGWLWRAGCLDGPRRRGRTRVKAGGGGRGVQRACGAWYCPPQPPMARPPRLHALHWKNDNNNINGGKENKEMIRTIHMDYYIRWKMWENLYVSIKSNFSLTPHTKKRFLRVVKNCRKWGLKGWLLKIYLNLVTRQQREGPKWHMDTQINKVYSILSLYFLQYLYIKQISTTPFVLNPPCSFFIPPPPPFAWHSPPVIGVGVKVGIRVHAVPWRGPEVRHTSHQPITLLPCRRDNVTHTHTHTHTHTQTEGYPITTETWSGMQ